MKKTFILAVASALFLASCGGDDKKKVEDLLNEATAAYSSGEYQKTKILIDSIRRTYPDAAKARRAALELMRNVEIAEQQRTISYCTETITQLDARRDSLLSFFKYKKENRYQDEGYYIPASGRKITGIYGASLEARVAENGTAYLTSFYSGKKIAHNSIKVMSGGSYTSCDKPLSSHIYSNLGVNNERLDFVYGSDGGMMDFIASSTDKVEVELKGTKGIKNYALNFDDVKGITMAVELARVLKSINEHKEMIAEAQRHLDFVQKTRERFAVDSVIVE